VRRKSTTRAAHNVNLTIDIRRTFLLRDFMILPGTRASSNSVVLAVVVVAPAGTRGF